LSLPSGTRIGSYEIAAKLGEGGMGAVYRARDAKLNRDVAIKVLLPDVADAERLARFRREAQVLAALSHPHVAHVYGFEIGEVSQGRDAATYLVMDSSRARRWRIGSRRARFH
jgi:serine/threonine protein kinase